MPINSMTGFASLAGSAGGLAWTWEARSFNARGLDLRLRLPEGLETLDAPLRAAATGVLLRGAVTIGLRLARAEAAGGARLNPEALEAAVTAALAAAETAARRGLDLAPMTAADLLGVRGVVESDAAVSPEDPAVREALAAQIAPLIASLSAARAEESAALARILRGQIARIETLAQAARESAGARAARSGAVLRERVAAVLGAGAAVDPARLAQELALIAVKADVTEELDRLDTHVASARALLEVGGPVGRKFDFLTQEFSREANTLCAKAGAADLTAIGLDLKLVVDQMREQVQNVE